MQIASAQISMGTSHSLQKQLSVRESLSHVEQTNRSTTQLAFERERTFTQVGVEEYLSEASAEKAMAEMQALAGRARSPLTSSDSAQAVAEGIAGRTSAAAPVDEASHDLPLTRDELQARMIGRLLQRMYGIALQEQSLSSDMWRSITSDVQAFSSQLEFTTGTQTDYRIEQEYYEAERSVFTASGEILTADGQRVAFSVEVGLAREFASKDCLAFSVGNLKDPLVIEFGGSASSLGSTHFAFDLTGSGKLDWLPTLGEGRGFLAIDRNADGLVNDGSELFGPSTGQGFQELAQLDEDGNGWLDEADSAFQQLRVWVPDESGDGQLFALADLGVGAIYLSSQATDFRFTDGRNNTQAQLRETGLYLTESGQAGLVRQIDLSV